MKKYLRYLGPVLISCLFLLAIYLLYQKLKAYSLEEIRQSIEQVSYFSIGLSIFLTVINYLILVGYDWLALKAIHKSLPLPRVGLVSLVGQSVSYNFGALLGGTTVRYRFYSAWGFSFSEIVRLVLMLAVTFWVGALGLSGLIFLVAPPVIPDELLAKMPIKDIRVLGVLLLSVAVVYLVLCFRVRKPVHIFGKEFVFPAPRLAVAQMVVAGVDLIAAASCMYVLLPHDLGISFIDFLPGYLMAQVAVVLTHIPGGVGVFELVILHLTHTPREQAVFAAVLLFRLIYYILPLLAAAVLLAVYEARQSRNMLREAGRWLSAVSHSVSAYLTFAAGVFLLVSMTLPVRAAALARMSEILPRALMGAGHFVCALSGAALLFVSYGLERRQRRAYLLATGALALGIAGALLNAFSWGCALMSAVVLLAVVLGRRRFYRSSFFWEEPIPLYWLGAAFGVLVVNFALGWFVYAPHWERAERWGFDQGFNAPHVLLGFAGIAALVIVGWLWRVSLRRHKRKREQKAQATGDA